MTVKTVSLHGQKFRGKNNREIELWNECGRLIANCMIYYYNTTLLNSLLTKLQKEKGNEKLIDMLKYISPVAWTHINLYGYYSFEESKHAIDMNALVESLNLMKI